MIGQRGVPGMPRECRLRRMISSITALTDGLNRWDDTDKSEASDLARSIAKVARFTDEFARDQAILVGRPIEHAERVLANWEKARLNRSEEHTSELQSLMRISYAVFCLKKKK